jgi:hypothetical protein
VDPSVILSLSKLSVSAVIVPYSSQQLEAQLSFVVGHFLNNVVEIDSARRELTLPKQFNLIELTGNGLLTWLYNFLDPRKKLDVLYLQSKSYTINVAKKTGKILPAKGLLAWQESLKKVQQPEDLPDIFGSPRSPRSKSRSSSALPVSRSSSSTGIPGRTSTAAPPVTAAAASASVGGVATGAADVARRMDRQESVLDDQIMRDSLSTLVQKVTGQLYDNQGLAQSIYAEVCKSVSVTIAFQTGKVIREIKMQLLDVEGITWTAASLEKFKQEIQMETPKLSRLQLLQVSEQKQQQILKLLSAIQTAVVDIRFLLESVVAALQRSPNMSVVLGRVSSAIKDRLQWTLDRVVEKNAESAMFEELITLESAIAPEIDALISLLEIYVQQIRGLDLAKMDERVTLLSLTGMLNWVRGQLESNKPLPVGYTAQEWDRNQLQAMSIGKLEGVSKTIQTVADNIANRLNLIKSRLLVDASREKLIDVALIIRSCRTAMTHSTSQ